jgi:hypothetical protein
MSESVGAASKVSLKCDPQSIETCEFLTARADQRDDAMSAIESQNDGGEAFTGSKSVEFYI